MENRQSGGVGINLKQPCGLPDMCRTGPGWGGGRLVVKLVKLVLLKDK